MGTCVYCELNMGFRHARGCYDWRVHLELGLHVDKLGNHGEDGRREMKGLLLR